MDERHAPDTSATARRPVTFLMTAFNAERTVEAAVRSLLAQSYEDFCVLVIDDGSADRTGEIVRRLAAEDNRLLYWPMEHVGLCSAVNAGLSRIQSRYVARMDADDISYPTRLEKQMCFLARHPEVKVLATRGYRIGDDGRRLASLGDGPGTIEQYVAFRLQRKPFFVLNSSVVADRRALVEYGGYRWDDYPADDVALYTRIAQDHPVLTLREELVGYRITPGGITSSNQWRMLVQFAKFDYNLQHGQSLDYESFERRLDSQPWTMLRMQWGWLYRSTLRYGAYHFFNRRSVLGLLLMLCGAAMKPHETLRKLLRAQTL